MITQRNELPALDLDAIRTRKLWRQTVLSLNDDKPTVIENDIDALLAEVDRLRVYEEECERAATLLQKRLTIGEVKHIGLREVAAGVAQLIKELNLIRCHFCGASFALDDPAARAHWRMCEQHPARAIISAARTYQAAEYAYIERGPADAGSTLPGTLWRARLDAITALFAALENK